MWNQTFFWGGNSLEGKVIKALMGVQIDYRQMKVLCDLFFGPFGGSFNPVTSNHEPGSSESLQGCSIQTLV